MRVNKFIGIFFLAMVIISSLKAQVKPTNEWVSFYGNSSLYQGAPIPVATQINAYNPQGILCGSFTVTKAGEYGFLAVYRDDVLTTAIDEGAVPGDTIRFTINGAPAKLMNPGVNVWTSNGATVKAELTTNRTPAVKRPMKDVILNEDAPPYTITDLDSVFFDPDKDALTFTVQSSVPEIQALKDSDNRLKLAVTPNWNGIGQVIAIASDGSLTARDTIKVTIKPVNDAPVVLRAIKDITLNEDAPPFTVANLDSVFSDPDKDALTYTIQSSVPEIQASKDSENRLKLTITPNWNGIGQIIAIASDGSLTARDTIKVTIKPVNDAPFVLRAMKDVTLNEDAPPYTVSDLDSVFSDPDKDALTFTVQSSVPEIQVTKDSENRLKFTLTADWNGAGQIIATASDGTLAVRDTVQVTIKPVNDAPMVVRPMKDIILNEDVSPYTVTDLDSVFSDPDKDALTFTVQSSVPEIQVTKDSENRLKFTLTADWNGAGQIIATASDGTLAVRDTVQVTIKPVNDAPMVVRPMKDIILNEDVSPYTVTDLDSVFSDPDKDILTCTVQSTMPEIQVTKDSENRLKLTVTPNWNGTGQVIAIASDGTLTARDTVQVTIKPINDAPIVVRPLKDVSLNEDAPPYTVTDLDSVFSDPDKDVLTFAVQSSVPEILVTKDSENRFKITLTANWNGTGQIIATASDGTLTARDTIKVTIKSINDAPVVLRPMKDVSLNEDAPPYTVTDLDSVFSDPDKDVLTFAVQSSVPEIQASMDSDNRLRVTITPNWNGTGQIIVIASDGVLSASDTVKVGIKTVNDAPVLAHPIKDVTLNEDTLSFTVTNLDSVFSDPDMDALTFTAQSSVPEIQVAIDSEKRLVLDFLTDWNGTGQIIASASDGVLAVQDTIIITLKPVNDAPVVVHPMKDITLDEDTPLYTIVYLDTVFTDIDKDSLKFTIQSSTLEFMLAVDNDNLLKLNLTPNWTGAGLLVASAFDGYFTARDTIMVLIRAVNDAPIVSHALADFSIDEDAPLFIAANLDTLFFDTDQDTLAFTVISDSSKLKTILTPDNHLSIQPQPNANGLVTMILKADDGHSAARDTVQVMINSVNDPPTISPMPDTCFVNKTMLELNLNLYASDVEEKPEQLRWDVKLLPDKKDSVKVSIDQSNTVTFQTKYNIAGKIAAIFAVSDSCKSTDADTINIRIDYPVGVERLQIAALPTDYCLSPNYPNPFNPETTIRFGLPRDGDVEITVYNLMGQQVRVIAEGAYKAGWHILLWNGQDDYGRQTGSGIYLIRLVANGVSRLQKMTLVR